MFSSGDTPNDELASLPPELHDLYRRLEADGAAWRESAGARIVSPDAVVRQQFSVPAHAHPQRYRPSSQTSLNGSRGDHMTTKPAGRARALFATVAAMVIIALFGALALIATHGPKAAQTPAATPSTPKGQWQTLDRLTIHTWTNAAGEPQVAPTNPQVVYETYNSSDALGTFHPGMKRTDDGGKTWHELALPVAAATLKNISAWVSPLDARVVFLRPLSLGKVECPAAQYVGDYGVCDQIFVSQDAGKTWKPAIMPDTGGVGFHIGSASAQGTALFADATCTTTQCDRIVKSTDGGLTWHLADVQVAAARELLCGFAAARTGSTLFAVTATKSSDCGFVSVTTGRLWRSDDAGVTWHQVATLASAMTDGMVVVDRGDGQPLLYIYSRHQTSASDKMGEPMYADAATDLRVSSDGGQHWASAPLAGVPQGQAPYFYLSSTLIDSSVIMNFSTPGESAGIDVAIYSWRAGDASWRKLTDGTGAGYITTSLAVSTAGGKDTLWLPITSGSPTDTDKDAYRVLRCDL
jgi:hypothetical protein